jgi:hypothetical protein
MEKVGLQVGGGQPCTRGQIGSGTLRIGAYLCIS